MDMLQKLKNRPYFARIDFKENGASDSQKYYIGLSYIALDEKL